MTNRHFILPSKYHTVNAMESLLFVVIISRDNFYLSEVVNEFKSKIVLLKQSAYHHVVGSEIEKGFLVGGALSFSSSKGTST